MQGTYDQWALNHSGGWTVENESLSPSPKYLKNNYIWTKEKHKDFILTLQYKLSAGANSGVFIRSNPDDPVKDGIEIQLLDGTRKQAKNNELDKRANGAIYSIVAPSEYNNHPAGEWNALLIHTHVPTIWNATGTELAPLEWKRNSDGSYEITRTLPNQIVYTSKAVPTSEAVYFRITLYNGTAEKLSELRLQNCVMLRGAPEFAELTTNNRYLEKPYATVHNPTKDRWVITAWEPHLRFFGNRQCPCLHSDPKLPDCSPGESVSVDGILTFYEGTDIESELARIDRTDWRSYLD